MPHAARRKNDINIEWLIRRHTKTIVLIISWVYSVCDISRYLCLFSSYFIFFFFFLMGPTYSVPDFVLFKLQLKNKNTNRNDGGTIFQHNSAAKTFARQKRWKITTKQKHQKIAVLTCCENHIAVIGKNAIGKSVMVVCSENIFGRFCRAVKKCCMRARFLF